MGRVYGMRDHGGFGPALEPDETRTFDYEAKCAGCGDAIELAGFPTPDGPEILDDQGELVKCYGCAQWAHPECIDGGYCLTCAKEIDNAKV